MSSSVPGIEVPVRVIGRYALYGEIAAGGMATVHFGRLLGPVGFARTVAIKRLHPHFAKDPEFVSMFLDEARLAARIRHPNVVPTVDVVATGGELFLVMEYVQGESLARLLRAMRLREERTPVRVVAPVICGTLRGLHAAHEARDEQGRPLNIVHRDMSPQNVLLGTDGVARVLDFGVAKAAGRLQATRDGQLKGKLSYMAPEQLRGEHTTRSADIFATAIVMWESLTGRRLFSGDNEAIILARVLEGVIEPPSVPVFAEFKDIPDDERKLYEALDPIVMKGLERDPEKRFKTAREMSVAIENVLAGWSVTQLGEWVEDVARDVLELRADRVAQLESCSAIATDSQHNILAQLRNDPPPTQPTPEGTGSVFSPTHEPSGTNPDFPPPEGGPKGDSHRAPPSAPTFVGSSKSGRMAVSPDRSEEEAPKRSSLYDSHSVKTGALVMHSSVAAAPRDPETGELLAADPGRSGARRKGRVAVAGAAAASFVILAAAAFAFRGNGGAATQGPAETTESRVSDYLSDGERALERFDLETAKEKIDKASAYAERDPRVVAVAARIAVARADVAWQRQLLLPADSAEARDNQAVLAATGATAEKQSASALELAPNDTPTLAARVDAHRVLGERAAAERVSAKLASAAPSPHASYALAALALANSKDGPVDADTVMRLQNAADVEATSSRALPLLVFALVRADRVDDAKRAAARLSSRESPHPLASVVRAFVERTAKGTPAPTPSDRPSGKTEAKAHGESAPGADPRSLVEQASAARKKGDLSRAKALYESALSSNPNSSEAVAGLGDVAAAQRDLSTAQTLYRRALSLNPNYLPAMLGLADSQWDSGDQTNAKKSYLAITDRFPSTAIPMHVRQRIDGSTGSGATGAAAGAVGRPTSSPPLERNLPPELKRTP
ncbi:MAG: protein kinase [Polyangiaceae bacterium]